MDYDSLEKNVGGPGKWRKRKIMPIHARISYIFFFDDFFRNGEKRKVKKLVGTVLRKTLPIQGYGEKGKICPYMPIFHFANNAPKGVVKALF